MAFQTGTATGVGDLLDDLETFLNAEGWTIRNLTTAGSYFFERTGGDDDVFVQFRYDTGSPNAVGVYQSDGFSGDLADAPGEHTDDSGQGAISGTDATLLTGRHVDVNGGGGFPARYWFFEDHSTSTPYFYAFVEIDTAECVNFGAGVLEKAGGADWTGGAFSFGWKRDLINLSSATSNACSFLLDGLATELLTANLRDFVATVHIEGMDDQPAGGKWAIVWARDTTANQGNDRQAVPVARIPILGGYRGHPVARAFGRYSADQTVAQVPGYPIFVWYKNTTPATDELIPLGNMPDVRGFNIEHYSVGDEITNGSDTWVVFPSWRNQLSNGTAEQGIAVKKVP